MAFQHRDDGAKCGYVNFISSLSQICGNSKDIGKVPPLGQMQGVAQARGRSWVLSLSQAMSNVSLI